MIKLNSLKNKINEILRKKYPIKSSFDNITDLSHFWIQGGIVDWNKYFPFHINIDGLILDTDYAKYKIIKVITMNNVEYYWKKYLSLYLSLLNISFNPIVNKYKFLFYLHLYNNIDALCIKSICVQYKKEKDVININYVKENKVKYDIYWNPDNRKIKLDDLRNRGDNHFYFHSFCVDHHSTEIRKELMRLFINRNKYKSIHFHLDNNGGGDLVPAHLIIRCLVGAKEKWMKNIVKKIMVKGNKRKIIEWDCWNPENVHNYNYETFKMLNLDFIPNYQNKYNGKIYLHMNTINGSASWFFITYLIYAFAHKIIRFNKLSFGKIIKFGTIKSNQLFINGMSGTTSGDGNSVNIKYKNIIIDCPTEQFISCSIKKKDMNRFWIGLNSLE